MKRVLLVATVGFTSSLLFGCGTVHSLASNAEADKPAAPKPTLALTGVHVTKNDGRELGVSLMAANRTNKAIYIQPSDFALISGTTTLSPDSHSQVPSQVPANSKTSVTLDFDVKGQLSGTVTPKLAFQPSGNEPEQFESVGSVKIPVPKAVSQPSTTSESTSKPSTTQTVTSVPLSSTTPDYQADVDQDYALIKSKVPSVAIVNTQPDAEVPDGFGNMLYAWNVILNGDGDGTAQQIYFFDGNRYIGTDTSSEHVPSKVHPGGTGSIVATYSHYLKNDPNCCPSGQPYVVTFHWNGSQLVPNAPQTLYDAVNNQFD
jgi:hypothetical protein